MKTIFLCFLFFSFKFAKSSKTYVTLDQKNPKNVFWLTDLNLNDIYSVCASNGTLQLFVTDQNILDLPRYLLFDGNDTSDSNLIGSLNSENLTAPLLPLFLPKSIKSISGCFTIKAKLRIFLTTDQSDTVLFRIVEETTKNCQSENNVFQIPHFFSQIPVTMSAKKQGSCEMIILSATAQNKALPLIWLSEITAKTNVGKFSFKSTINDKILVVINSSQILSWRSFGIYTPALSIIIPAANNIAIDLSKPSKNFSWNYTVSLMPRKGLLMTPDICGFNKTFKNYLLYSFEFDQDASVNFEIKEKGDIFPYINDEPLVNNRTAILGSMEIYANRTNANIKGFLIEYTIRILPPSTTTSLTMTSIATTTEIENISSSTNKDVTTTKQQYFSSSTISTPAISSPKTTTIATTSATKTMSSLSTERTTILTEPSSSSTIFSTKTEYISSSFPTSEVPKIASSTSTPTSTSSTTTTTIKNNNGSTKHYYTFAVLLTFSFMAANFLF